MTHSVPEIDGGREVVKEEKGEEKRRRGRVETRREEIVKSPNQHYLMSQGQN